jgi:hypothetical protein
MQTGHSNTYPQYWPIRMNAKIVRSARLIVAFDRNTTSAAKRTKAGATSVRSRALRPEARQIRVQVLPSQVCHGSPQMGHQSRPFDIWASGLEVDPVHAHHIQVGKSCLCCFEQFPIASRFC